MPSAQPTYGAGPVAGGNGQPLPPTEEVAGVLDIEGADNHGVVRPTFKPSEGDIYLPSAQIRMLGLKNN